MHVVNKIPILAEDLKVGDCLYTINEVKRKHVISRDFHEFSKSRLSCKIFYAKMSVTGVVSTFVLRVCTDCLENSRFLENSSQHLY
jgi:hypothetical protein